MGVKNGRPRNADDQLTDSGEQTRNIGANIEKKAEGEAK